MLVEVNLLPEKNRRNITYPFLFLLVLAVIAIGTTILYSYQSHITHDVQETKQEIANVRLEAAEIREQMIVAEDSGYDRLAEAVQTLEKEVVPASLLLDYLVRGLPERGFYLNFDYDLPGRVRFDASFDRMEELAAYHHTLEQSDLVSSVSLSIIHTKELVNASAEVLPRYVASFELNVKKSEVRKLGDGQ